MLFLVHILQRLKAIALVFLPMLSYYLQYSVQLDAFSSTFSKIYTFASLDLKMLDLYVKYLHFVDNVRS